MIKARVKTTFCGVISFVLLFALHTQAQSNWTVIGWNNLGMHCMDSDYTVFSILPPYNTFHAQVIDSSGNLVTNREGIGVSYHSIADLDGSINRTSRGKTGFWNYEDAYFGLSLPEDVGLPVPGPEMFAMPGTNNTPQSMRFEEGINWFAAHGVPIAPYDDNDKPNQYPMMRLMLTNAAGDVLAMSDIVLPVSDEMDCSLCHASSSGPAAEPAAGWVMDNHPGRDYRLNILRLHDERGLTNANYVAALATNGFNPAGLYTTATADNRPILCASCHLSEALPGSGVAGIPPLTEAMHAGHEVVIDPRNGMSLGSDANRQSCYTCHPGSETRCLRGAMGRAVAPDGSMSMQCQSCHGGMADVGSPTRTGWLDEPNCQACHVGSATNSFGVIRFTDALTNGSFRVPDEDRFATNPDTPAPGHSLYRFSKGHGGLQCSACHGSTHAIYPTAHANDNISSSQIQGHGGTLGECTACHQTMPNTRSGGPHGMHTIGQGWIEDHNDAASNQGRDSCRTCHGQNGEGSVLSLTLSAKYISSEKGSVNYFKGQKVTCWGCHDGMYSSDGTSKGVPTVTDTSGVTTSGVPVAIALNGSNLRIVGQPRYGLLALSGTTATYFPDGNFVGEDSFTFCANNGFNDSNLGNVEITVLADPSGLPPPDASEIFAMMMAGDAELGLMTELGDLYRVESSTNLNEETWEEETGPIWGHMDATWVPSDGVFDYMRHFRAVTIDDPGVPVPASDDGTQPEYDTDWANLSNGGSGFSNWTLAVTGGGSGGHFMATNSADLDAETRSWGLWANGGSTAEAVRSFNPPLDVGDAISFWFENNFIDNGQEVGVDFMNASGTLLLRFFFVGGQGTYRVSDYAGSRATKIPWSNKGRTVTFRASVGGDYTLACNDHSVPGMLISDPDQRVGSVRFWNESAGSGSDHDLYVNDLRVLSP